MPEQQEPNAQDVQKQDPNMDDIIKQIDDLKKNSVPLEKYNKLYEDNKKLTKALIEGKQIEDPDKKKNDISQKDLLARAFKADGRSNLDHWHDVLEFRKREIEAGRQDPFVAMTTSRHTPTQESYAAAERVAEGIEDLINQSGGDPKVFDSLFDSCLKEPLLPKFRQGEL